jgi:hypothetical protein
VTIGRLVGAGLLAGLVLNVGEAVLHGVVHADATEAAMKGLGQRGRRWRSRDSEARFARAAEAVGIGFQRIMIKREPNESLTR